MKHLSNYTEKPQSELFDRLGVFFAFSTQQFNKSKKENVKYCNMGQGMICPVGTGKEVMDELDKIQQQGIAQDIAENGRNCIISRELGNHECYYTGSISDCVDCLEQYDITREEIAEVFQAEWSKQANESEV